MTIRNIQITNRDKEILKFIQKLPLCTSKQIHETIFSDTSYSSAARRIQKLYAHKLIQRHTITGQQCYRYSVTQSICNQFQIPYKAIKRVRHQNIQHDLELYDCLRTIQSQHKAITIIPDFELSHKAKRNYRHTFCYKGVIQSSELRLLPDAILTLDNHCCFFEWDRDTIHGIHLHKKLMAYKLLLEEISLRNTSPNTKYHVLFLCPSQRRIENIKKVESCLGIRCSSFTGLIQDTAEMQRYIQSLNCQ